MGNPVAGVTLIAMVAPAAGAGGAGLLGLAMTSAWLGSSPPPADVPVVPATKDNALFAHWDMDDDGLFADGVPSEPNCTWWNGTVRFNSDLCSHFSLSRIASTSSGRAIDRALKCAAQYETECIISPEVGVSIPAAFVYDDTADSTGMRMLIAPRILHPIGTDTRSIRVQDPTEKTNGRVLELNHTILVEYLPGGSRAPVSEQLNGSNAYCVQLLRSAFVEECWSQLD